MPAIRLRFFVAVVLFALTTIAAAVAAAPLLYVMSFDEAGTRAAASPGAMVPSYALRVRMPEMFAGQPNSALADPARGCRM